MKPYLKLALTGLVILSIYACTKDTSPTDETGKEPPIDETENKAPDSFALSGISNQAIDVSVSPDLSWEAAVDADGDTVTYDLILEDTENPTTVIASNLSTTEFSISESLSFGTTYYWSVMAKDDKGNTTQSEIYSFTTEGQVFALSEVTEEANFYEITGHQSVVFDGKMWIIGWVYSNGYKGVVWHSTDGVNWTLATGNAPFKGRSEHKALVYDNKMWVIGGFRHGLEEYQDDVWYSEDGITWTEATSNAAFSDKEGFNALTYDGKMWVIGGHAWQRKSDVWSSTDGATWTQATNDAAFGEIIGHEAIVFNDKMWVLNGKSIWNSTDGVSWTEATSTAEYTTRHESSMTVYADKMWLIAGISHITETNPDIDPSHEIWYSSDGVNWIEQDIGDFPGRKGHSSVTYNDKIYIIGGSDRVYLQQRNDVWSIE